MTAKPSSSAKPFSYCIDVAGVPEGGLDVSVTADAEALRALAALDGLAALASLTAEFHVAPRPDSSFNVSGEVRAKVTQICVVSLEPFESTIVEPIDVDFAPLDMAEARAAAMSEAPSGEEREPPDPIVDGQIDLGALAAEFLALGLDPYPRKPGVAFEPPAELRQASDTTFAVLSKLKPPS